MKTGADLTLRALLLAAVAVLLIVVMLGHQIVQSRRDALESAAKNMEQLSVLLETSTTSTFQAAELILHHAIEIAHEEGDSMARLDGSFTDTVKEWPFIHSIFITDTDGNLQSVVYRDSEGMVKAPHTPFLIRDQALFSAHAADGTPHILISGARKSYVSEEWVVTVSESVHGSDGAFQGVVGIAIKLETFIEIFRSLLPPGSGDIGVFKMDGTLLASRPTNAELASHSFKDSHLFRELLPINPAGVYDASSFNPQYARIMAYRMSQKYPVVVVVGMMKDRILTDWWGGTAYHIASIAVSVILILASTYWVMRRIAHEAEVKNALLKSERSLAESQRIIGVGHFEYNPHTDEYTWSSNMYAVHGVRPGAFTPERESFLRLVASDDRARLDSLLRSMSHVPVGGFSCRVCKPDGTWRHMRYDWKVIEGDESKPVKVFGVCQDITAMRTAEEAIRESEARLRDYVECSSDYIWETNGEGKITLLAGTGAEGLTYMLGHHASEFLAATDEPSDIGLMKNAVKARVGYRNLIMPVTTEKGKVIWVRGSGNPRFDSTGRFLGYRGVSTDVTDVRQRHRQNEAQRKTEALGRLASGVAHEINNLLQPIVIYAAMEPSQSLDADTVRQRMNRIGRAAEKAILILKNILTFARQSPPRSGEVDVLGVVRETVDLLGGAQPSSVILRVVADVESPAVLVDRGGLSQLLTNLINNAVEAVNGDGNITVRVAEIDLPSIDARAVGVAAGRYCRLDVEDDGRGIPREAIGKVFDPFFTTKPQGQGTGLGLSVAAGLAKSWGGSVTVVSEPNVRTVFSVYLPLTLKRQYAAE